MAAKIYSAPEEIKQPSIDFTQSMSEWEKQDQEYLDKLKGWLKENNFKGKNAGEVIRLPWADSYAQYMVMSMHPLQLFHIPLGDAWDHPDADLLTAKRVQQKIDADKAMQKLFGK
jgi:hypothetical protein